VKRKRASNLVLTAGLLLTLALFTGCSPVGAGGAGIWSLILLLAVIVGMSYFLMIRPLRQREKKHDIMVANLEKGETVITAGGIYGVVESIDEDSVVLKVESGATIRVTKGGVAARPEEQRIPDYRREQF